MGLVQHVGGEIEPGAPHWDVDLHDTHIEVSVLIELDQVLALVPGDREEGLTLDVHCGQDSPRLHPGDREQQRVGYLRAGGGLAEQIDVASMDSGHTQCGPKQQRGEPHCQGYRPRHDASSSCSL